jgi:hypothetical protein
MSRVRTFSLVVVSASVWFASAAYAQAPAKPGPEHALLKSMEGAWDCVVKMGDQESKATSTTKAALGGLWMITDFKGSLGGESYEGHGVDGYDPDKKKYIGTWTDSMSTTMMTFEGTYDEGTKTLTMYSSGKGPDGNPAKWKGVTTHKDKDHQTFKMYLVQDGAENLMMSIDYTRKK